MNKSHLKLFFLFLILAAAAPLFAQDPLAALGLNSLEDFARNVQAVFTGTIVRIILVCCFIGTFVKYAFGKNSDQMKTGLIAGMIGSFGIGAASYIVGAIIPE